MTDLSSTLKNLLQYKKPHLNFLPKIHNPAHKLLLKSVYQNRRLLSISFFSSSVAAVFEGITFALIALALSVLNGNSISELKTDFHLTNFGIGFDLDSLKRSDLFLGLIILAILLQLLRSSFLLIGNIANTYLGNNIESYIQKVVYRRIMSFSWSCIGRYRCGDLSDFVTGQSPFISETAERLRALLVAVLSMFAYSVILLFISIPLTVIAVILFSLISIFHKDLISRLGRISRKISIARAELSEEIIESFHGLRLIYSFDLQRKFVRKINHSIDEIVDLNKKSGWILGIANPLTNSLMIIAIGLFLCLGFFVLDNENASTLPKLITFIAVLNRLSSRFSTLSSATTDIARRLGVVSRLGEILNEQDKEFIQSSGETFPGLEKEILLDNVSLKYPTSKNYALKSVSFTLAKDTVVALVGSSGAGKSSISDLLLRLYQPTSGYISVDGIDLNQFSLSSWLNSVAVVSQDVFLLNDTISANIQLDSKRISDSEIMEAAKLAHAHEFIMELPKGYNTVIGELGIQLSGGQRQRIALARAILRQSEVLIIDEGTSALDSKSEHLVQESILKIRKQRAVLIIAHRLSTINQADHIIVLDQGAIIEQGTHNELLRLNGKYASYWKLQTQTF